MDGSNAWSGGRAVKAAGAPPRLGQRSGINGERRGLAARAGAGLLPNQRRAERRALVVAVRATSDPLDRGGNLHMLGLHVHGRALRWHAARGIGAARESGAARGAALLQLT
jgi:hypothetical protein